jgi:hypothetical protein
VREETGILAGVTGRCTDLRSRRLGRTLVSAHAGSHGSEHGDVGIESSTEEKGEVEMTLLSRRHLQLMWWITQFGSQEALSSGIVMLMRLRMP